MKKKKKEYLVALLNNADGRHVDPANIVARIPPGLGLGLVHGGLRDTLLSVLANSRAQAAFHEATLHVLDADCEHLAQRLTRTVPLGLPVEGEHNL